MSDIVIEKEIVMKPIGEIKPYEHNPRRNDKTVELLCRIIPKVGFNVPLVIDSNGVIVKGHARYTAAKQLGIAELPCIITHADADAIKADRIADNKISEFSEWINQELMHEVDMLDIDFDLSDMGLPKVSYSDLPTFDDFGADVNDDDEEKMSEEERQRVYAEFLERQAQENTVSVQMTTQGAIKAAMQKQMSVPKAQREYGQCTCEKCGNIMYVDRNILYDIEKGTVRRR